VRPMRNAECGMRSGKQTSKASARDRSRAVGKTECKPGRAPAPLLAIPGMHKSIREGLRVPLDKCSKEPGWCEPSAETGCGMRSERRKAQNPI